MRQRRQRRERVPVWRGQRHTCGGGGSAANVSRLSAVIVAAVLLG